MAGDTPGFFDNMACASTVTDERLTSNLWWLLGIIAVLIPFTGGSSWILLKLTGLALPANRATAVIILLIIFLMLLPWMTDTDGLANPFLACPTDFKIFMTLITVCTIGVVELLLAAALLLRIPVVAFRYSPIVTAIFFLLLLTLLEFSEQ